MNESYDVRVWANVCLCVWMCPTTWSNNSSVGMDFCWNLLKVGCRFPSRFVHFCFHFFVYCCRSCSQCAAQLAISMIKNALNLVCSGRYDISSKLETFLRFFLFIPFFSLFYSLRALLVLLSCCALWADGVRIYCRFSEPPLKKQNKKLFPLFVVASFTHSRLWRVSWFFDTRACVRSAFKCESMRPKKNRMKVNEMCNAGKKFSIVFRGSLRQHIMTTPTYLLITKMR